MRRSLAHTSVRGPVLDLNIYIHRENRQEVPLHERCLHPWPHPHRPCRLHQDDPHHHHPPRLPPLHPQVQCVSKSTNTQISPAHYFLSDRYEKRHKNLAAHVSPAFRVELGDTVTVGAQSRSSLLRHSEMLIVPVHRPVPPAVQDGAFQRAPRVQEQGGGQVVWQVLSRRCTCARRFCDWGVVGYGIIVFSCAMTASK